MPTRGLGHSMSEMTVKPKLSSRKKHVYQLSVRLLLPIVHNFLSSGLKHGVVLFISCVEQRGVFMLSLTLSGSHGDVIEVVFNAIPA